MDFAPLDLAPAEIDARKTPNGGYLLRSPKALEPYEEAGGDVPPLGQGDPRQNLPRGAGRLGAVAARDVGEAGRLADSVAQALIDRRMGSERTVMILSGNSIDHALLMLGGSSPAYRWSRSPWRTRC